MESTANTSGYKRSRYKGGSGMWSWILHRGSGLAVLGFLFLHVVDTSLIMFGPDVYNAMAHLYESAFFRPMEVLLMFLVTYHAFNGLRVIVVDFWPSAARVQVQLTRAVWVVTMAIFIPSAYIMLKPIF